MATAHLYPWQHDLWTSVTNRVTNQRLPHALLLTGPAETGRQTFASLLSNYMVCRHKTENMPCGSCKDCLLFQADTHPDLVNIFPEAAFKQIRIDQVRDMATFLGCHSNQGGYRVITISPAENMNINAANALLKTLEEPGKDILIMLIAQRPERLLATIRSRCQQLRFPLPNKDIATTWLKEQLPEYTDIASVLEMAQGRPLAALRYVHENFKEKCVLLISGLKAILSAEQPLTEISLSWKELDSLFIFEWMLFAVTTIVRYKMTHQVSVLPAWLQDDAFLTLINHASATTLMEYYCWLTESYGLLVRQINLNTQLLNEALLIHWQKILLRVG
ncbi:MAG: DNA polymerase III subunit delta' [Endozoicomonadaceae bacterium]|nr:DNA polymerase III subunit delta' [Endozoicomonadaceae bacterium]